MKSGERMLLVLALLSTIVEAGDSGAPSGPMYAGLMGRGVTLDTYNDITGFLQSQGWVTLEHHVFRATQAGRDMNAKLERTIAQHKAQRVAQEVTEAGAKGAPIDRRGDGS